MSDRLAREIQERRAMGFSYRPHPTLEHELAARRAMGFSYQPPVKGVPVDLKRTTKEES